MDSVHASFGSNHCATLENGQWNAGVLEAGEEPDVLQAQGSPYGGKGEEHVLAVSIQSVESLASHVLNHGPGMVGQDTRLLRVQTKGEWMSSECAVQPTEFVRRGGEPGFSQQPNGRCT